MKIDILTLFPEMFVPVTESSMLGRACEKGILDIRLTDIRDYTLDKHNRTDEYPFGGGTGMVLQAEPVFRAIEAVTGVSGADWKEKGNRKCIYMSPRGKILDRQKIEELSEEEELMILCGHYEGVDQRILDQFDMEEISIGDFVLTGGELPAMVLIDSVARFIPGVLGDSEGITDESVYSGLLEYDQYTKPREYAGLAVPEVLYGGNHKEIALWKFERSLQITKERRPDLFQAYLESHGDLSKDERKILEKYTDKKTLSGTK